MPFPFVYVCDLLESAQGRHAVGKDNADAVTAWFARHRAVIDAPDTQGSALLSVLLPEKRTDRVYGIQAPTLQRIIGRGLSLRSDRLRRLGRYQEPGLGLDLADCVELILRETPNAALKPHQATTVEEIDRLLHGIAANCRFSSPSVRLSGPALRDRNRVDLERIYQRLAPHEAKWFTRLVLKDYSPIVFNELLIYRSYDILLPMMIKVHDSLAASLDLLQTIKGNDANGRLTPTKRLKDLVRPKLGVKVGRQPFFKGRSIKHCLDMGRGNMSCEKKYDGEYCQIHIDLSKEGRRRIQIFSKSGKDSTSDRVLLHSAIMDSLGIGATSCRFKKGCIVEGELVVYSDKEKRILPFHKIRKYVSRSGRFIGTERDSQQHPYEHLMIVYFDVLLIDDESLIGTRHSERFRRLTELVTCRKGRAELVHRQIISFNHHMAAFTLRKAFADCIKGREEGLILKPDDPYFDFSPERRDFSCCAIKLKKAYIGSFGDVGDFAVIGARYDPATAKSYRLPRLRWTHFYLACLNNKEQVRRWQVKPDFTIVNVVSLSDTILETVIKYSNPSTVDWDKNESLLIRYSPGVDRGKRPSVVFTDPMVFDVRCFEFDKVGGTDFWSLRFPAVTKVHFDRTWLDTLSFEELQAIALERAPELGDSQEMQQWIAALERADPRGIPVDAVSQLTASSVATPARSSQNSRLSVSQEVPASIAENVLVALTSTGESTQSCHPIGTGGDVEDPPAQAVVTPNGGATRKRKMGLGSAPSQRKRLRHAQAASASASFSSPSGNTQPPTLNRCPLSEISHNASFSLLRTPTTSFYMVNSGPNKSFPTEDAPPCDTQPSTTESQPSVTSTRVLSSQTIPSSAPDAVQAVETTPQSRSQDQNTPPAPSLDEDMIKCPVRGRECLFVNCVLLLSPCIANMPFVSEDLLSSHGITNFYTEPEDWGSEVVFDEIRDVTPKLTRVCLVEARRRDATDAFLQRIGNSGINLPDGSRDWVEVYDWRILEAAGRLESGEDKTEVLKGWSSVWRKYYVGLA